MEKEKNMKEILRPIKTRDLLENSMEILKELEVFLSEEDAVIYERLKEIKEEYGQRVDLYKEPQERLQAAEEFFSNPNLEDEVFGIYQKVSKLKDARPMTT